MFDFIFFLRNWDLGCVFSQSHCTSITWTAVIFYMWGKLYGIKKDMLRNQPLLDSLPNASSGLQTHIRTTVNRPRHSCSYIFIVNCVHSYSLWFIILPTGSWPNNLQHYPGACVNMIRHRQVCCVWIQHLAHVHIQNRIKWLQAVFECICHNRGNCVYECQPQSHYVAEFTGEY